MALFNEQASHARCRCRLSVRFVESARVCVGVAGVMSVRRAWCLRPFSLPGVSLPSNVSVPQRRPPTGHFAVTIQVADGTIKAGVSCGRTPVILWSFPSVVSRPVSGTGLVHLAGSLTHTLATGRRLEGRVREVSARCWPWWLLLELGETGGPCGRLSSVVVPTCNTGLQLRPESRPRCIETCRNLKIGSSSSSSSRARYQSVVSG